jgi:hypothetical protein
MTIIITISLTIVVLQPQRNVKLAGKVERTLKEGGRVRNSINLAIVSANNH